MSNILMRFCKETNGYTNETIAKAMGISTQQYTEIESGELLVTYEQAQTMGGLYKVNGDYFYNSAMQLDLLLARKEVIKILKWKNDQLEEKLKPIYKPVQNRGTRKGKKKNNSPS